MVIIGDGLRNLKGKMYNDLYKTLQDPTAFREEVLSLFKEKESIQDNI